MHISQLVNYNEELRLKNERLERKWGNLDRAVPVVCEAFGVNPNRLDNQQREKALTRARQVLYFLGYEYFGMTMTEVAGRFLKDHTTVIKGVRRIQELRAKKPDVDAIISSVEGRLGLVDPAKKNVPPPVR